MTEIVESVFCVKIANEKQICLKELKNGFKVFVEPNSKEYERKIKMKISNLKTNEKIKATLKSQNELHTIWTFNTIEKNIK